MPFAETDDGVRLHYEEIGQGAPMIFVHEFAGDCRSWEAQVRAFARRNRCITYNARGYPPSDVPEDGAMYSQARVCADIKAVLDHLGIGSAHVVVLSMGGFATLHFGLTYPGMALSLVVAGCGYGAEPDRRAKFRDEAAATADLIEAEGMVAFAAIYGAGATRVQFQNKDPRGWAEFVRMLEEHSATGSALTMRGVQRERPSLWDLEDGLRTLDVPTLIFTGDEEEPCLLPGVFMQRAIRTAGLVVIPKAGHNVNQEDPEPFNRAVADFHAAVAAGRWEARDPRSVTESILGER